LVASARFLDIANPPGYRLRNEVDRLKRRSRTAIETIASAGEPASTTFEPHVLLEPYHEIVASAKRIAGEAGPNLIVDVSALPKRFYFPLVKILLRERAQANILVTYTVAARHAEGPLAEDLSDPQEVPLFRAYPDDDREQMLVVALGLDASGIQKVTSEREVGEIKVLFPYPTPPPQQARRWDAFRDSMRPFAQERIEIIGVSGMAMPAAYDALYNLTDAGNRSALLAPYGPKPVSVAMLLFASGVGQQTASVVYTQPKYYNPAYSSGVATARDGTPLIYAYPLRLGGRNLY